MSSSSDARTGDPAGPDPAAVVVCPDKFRGSLGAERAAEAIAVGLRSAGVLRVHTLPVADGGEGTVDCCLATGFLARELKVRGADGGVVSARIATQDGLAVIEAAQACGLNRADPSPADALSATSFGVGEMIRFALDLGFRRLVIGVGGTASTDGGAGLLQALGVRLRDARGAEIGPGGKGLAALTDVDCSDLDARLAACELLVASDVDNPLLGPRGAVKSFAVQKGADPHACARLEDGLSRLAQAMDSCPWNQPHSETAGAGAGGGIGYSLLVAGARRVSGADTVLDLISFDDLAGQARLVVTGEGSLDETSLGGKAPVTIACRARRLGRPVVAIAGRSTLTPAQQRRAGFERIYELVDLAGSSERSMSEAASLLTLAGARIGVCLSSGALVQADDSSLSSCGLPWSSEP